MKRIIRLTESDLTRIVKRIIVEQKTHSGLASAYDKLKSHGFTLDTNLMTVSKGDDMNGAVIGYRSSQDKYILEVTVDGKSKISKEYPLDKNFLVDVDQIIKDLGMYKTYKFKKTPYQG